MKKISKVHRGNCKTSKSRNMQRSHIGNAFTNLHEGNTQSSHVGNAFIDIHVGNINISKPFLNSNCTNQSKD